MIRAFSSNICSHSARRSSSKRRRVTSTETLSSSSASTFRLAGTTVISLVAHDDVLAVAGDLVVIGGFDDCGELALGEVEELDHLGGFVPGIAGMLGTELSALGISRAHPEQPGLDGLEIAEDTRGDREGHDPLLGPVELDLGGGRGLLTPRPLGLRILGGLADRPAGGARAEGR